MVEHVEAPPGAPRTAHGAAARRAWVRPPRVPLGVEIALAFVAGAGTFAAVAVAVARIESGVVAVLPGAVCLVVVIAVARTLSIAYAVPIAMAGVLAYDWFDLSPTHPLAFPDSADLVELVAYLAVGVLVGQLAVQASRRAEASERARGALADEQAALRRVATLVAQESSPEEVFAAVAEELGRVLDVKDTRIIRYDTDGMASVVASWGQLETSMPVGARVSLEGDNASSRVLRTGRPARVDNYSHAAGSLAKSVRGMGVTSAVASPIIVEGRVWGAMLAASLTAQPLPARTEARISEFTDLVATAISNMEARSELAASRARIVAATDEERRRVVRDLHDGAQQRLVHTVVTLKLARQAVQAEEATAQELVTEALDQAERATAELRELAHGILPAVLTHGGLRAGVDALASRTPVPVETDVSVGRLPAAVEATAYFVVAEALTNIAKHARAEHAAVGARVQDGTLRVDVRDDGVGGARTDGTGFLGLADRVAVLNGRLRVESPRDGGTRVEVAIPVPDVSSTQEPPRRSSLSR